MKRLLLYSVICFLSGLLLISCERGVRADREQGPATYQPRPAPVEQERAVPPKDVKGELISIDVKNNLMMVRAENGMEQTFRFNDNTLVLGVEPQRINAKTTSQIAVRDLIGKEGSEVAVTWNEEAGAKMATSVTVDQLVSRKGSLRKGSWRKR